MTTNDKPEFWVVTGMVEDLQDCGPGQAPDYMQ